MSKGYRSHWHPKMLSFLSAFLLPAFCGLTAEQVPPARSQNDTFGASYGPNINPSSAAARIAQAGLSPDAAAAALVTLNFERSNWAGSSTQIDPFYNDLPVNSSSLLAGSIVKVELFTNTSEYSLPPMVALSRFVYTTRSLNGTIVPASAYILWPYSPRQFSNTTSTATRIPVVAWAHGAGGWTGECAASHQRNLRNQFEAPYALAQQGFAVVAPDFAGIGVTHTVNGTFIPHQLLAYDAQANDVLYSLQAAWSAFPHLDSKYVLMGHSTGGGAMWAAATLLANESNDFSPAILEGYLGTIAVSPATQVYDRTDYLAAAGPWISSVFPTFNFNTYLTPLGQAISGDQTGSSLVTDLQGCTPFFTQVFASSKADYWAGQQTWNETWYFKAINKLIDVEGRLFQGPMLVLQGTADVSVLKTWTDTAVNATIANSANKEQTLQYTILEGVGHSPTMYAGQSLWLKWMDERFSGATPLPAGYSTTTVKPVLDLTRYELAGRYFVEYALYPYETS
jgi:pimeloyl-ACP methyl ester carboxylesterase